MLKKVLFLTNIPSPYRVDFFNDLGKYVDLTVLFEIETSTERDESWGNYSFQNFKGIVLKGIRTGIDRAFCPDVVKYLDGSYDMVIIGNLASLTGLLATRWLKKHHIPYAYEGDGGIVKQKTGMKAWWKRYIIKDATCCFSTTEAFDEYCTAYGASENKIIRYPLSSVWEKDVLPQALDETQKDAIKEHLQIPEKHMIVSVGRIIRLKGFDVLLKAYAKLQNPEWGLYIIGGECSSELEEIIKEYNLENVHFISFVLPDDLKEYYKASDLFILPTRYDPWGLVVHEAMAQGLPIITTHECGAGTEMVKEDVNGFLYSCEDIDTLVRKTAELMNDDEKRRKSGEESLRIAHEFTIEKMTQAHMEVIGTARQAKCLLCCPLVPTEFEMDVPIMSNAGNRFLTNYLAEFSRDNETEVMSYLGVPVDETVQKRLQEDHSTAYQITYFFKTGNVYRVAKCFHKEMKKRLEDNDYVICYNPIYAWLFAADIAKKLGKKSVLLLADYSPVKSYSGLIGKVYSRMQLRAIRRFDYVVGLSEHTEKYLTDKQHFICMEGGIDKNTYEYFSNPDKETAEAVQIMYSGTLEPVTGIRLLIKAFERLEQRNIRLVISGKGSLVSEIEEIAAKNDRIQFLGCIPYEEYLEKLKEADILVNPRDMRFPENENNFPSKIMEYLVTGKYIISTQFAGWENFRECVAFCGSTETDMEFAIRDCMDDESYKDETIFERNRSFAQKYLWSEQVKKIQKMVKL